VLCDNATHATQLQNDVVIGANTVISSGVTVAAGAVVMPGSVVTRDVPPHAVVSGNPARTSHYTQSSAASTSGEHATPPTPGQTATKVRGVVVCRMKHVRDLRGDLSVGEFERDVPFPVQRYFLVFDVPSEETRGEHAHFACHQFLLCVKGACSVVADDGVNREEIRLDSPTLGVYLPPLTWGIQYKYTPDAVLLVFASHRYEAADYIRDYPQFLEVLRNKQPLS
jgi:UDP-2-acetamido-3-amino-2,3-dideoxy-glucuronate N-acetyltransferase